MLFLNGLFFVRLAMDKLRVQVFGVVMSADETAVTWKMSKYSQWFNPQNVDVWNSKWQFLLGGCLVIF